MPPRALLISWNKVRRTCHVKSAWSGAAGDVNYIDETVTVHLPMVSPCVTIWTPINNW